MKGAGWCGAAALPEPSGARRRPPITVRSVDGDAPGPASR